MSRIFPSILLATTLGGCIVAPAPYAPPPRAVYAPGAGVVYAPPAGVVYVGPSYDIPGPGYLWRYHPRFGWGWWHPHYGWHRGWR